MSVGGRLSTPLSSRRGAGGEAAGRGAWASLSASYTRSDGFSRNKAGGLNADYNCAKAFYEGGYGTESVRVRWHAGLSAKNFGSNTFYGVKSDDQFEHTFKSFTAVQAEAQAGRFHLRPALYWNHHYDRFEYFRGRGDAVPFNYHRTDVYGLNLNSYFDWKGGRTALGMEMRNEDLVSGNLGEPLDHPKHIHGTDRDYLYGLNRTNISLNLEHNILLQRFTLSAGLVAVKNSWADMGVRVYPGIDMAYRIGNDWKVFASYNTSLRMPSATELYYSVEGYKADKHLKPEELTAIEGGVKVQNYGMTAQVSIFYNHHKNLIDWIRHTDKGADAPWESVNFGSIDAVGIETSAQLNLLRLLPHQSLLQRLSLSYCYISQRQQEKEGIQSKYALEYLRHKLVARLQTRVWKQLFFDMSWRLQERMGSYTATDGTVEHYGGYGIVDCRLAWKGRMLEVHGDVNNLFGRRYVDYGNVPQAGTWVVAGVKVRM
jgi:iron complex outermembrane receptor protein